MAPNIRTTWFLPATRDNPAEDALTLGNTLEAADVPDERINTSAAPSIPAKLIREQRIQPTWNWSKEFARSKSGGIFASFLQIVGIGADIDGTLGTNYKDTYTAQEMLTLRFEPDDKYVQECLKDQQVRRKLIGPNRLKKVFMISGIKIAYGATRAMELMTSRNVHAQIGIDIGAVGAIPISVGPKAGYETSTTEKLSIGATNFVFAYQLKLLKFKGGEVVIKPYEKGTLYGKRRREELPEPNIDVADIELTDVSPEDIADYQMEYRQTVDENGDAVNYMVGTLD